MQVHALRDTLLPYLLRRLKEDVEKSIPPKEEVIVEVRASPSPFVRNRQTL
jgi:SNF2 family DNA or RNA helicase